MDGVRKTGDENIFFCRQKTAYEVKECDWSSDVCSSDLSMMLYGFRDREAILAFFEKTTGLRMNHNYIRPGGVAADLPDGWEADIEDIIEKVLAGVADYEDLLKHNPIWEERTIGVGVITSEEALASG